MLGASYSPRILQGSYKKLSKLFSADPRFASLFQNADRDPFALLKAGLGLGPVANAPHVFGARLTNL